MISHSARILATSLAFSMIVLTAGSALAGGGGGSIEKDTIGIFSSNGDVFYLRNSNTPGVANITASYGPSDTIPLIGDWLSAAPENDTLGAYSPSRGTFFLRNTNTEGPANTVVVYGSAPSTMSPLVGDWDGNSADTVGLYDRASGRFLLRNANTNGTATVNVRFGPINDANIVALRGNWNGGDAIDGIGLYDPDAGTFYLKNNPATSGGADLTIRFGPFNSTLIPVVGNWNDDDIDTIALYDPVTGVFMIRNTNTPGAANLTVKYGPRGAGPLPVSGNYDGN